MCYSTSNFYSLLLAIGGGALQNSPVQTRGGQQKYTRKTALPTS